MKRLTQTLQLPFIPLALVSLGWFAPLLVMGKALFWGTPMLQFIPWWHWAWETLRAGHLPLWNPLLGMGAPLLANYQSALFYPPHWLYLLAEVLGGLSALAWVQALLVILHLVWAGMGMERLVRRIGLGGLAQAIAGLAFGLCGYMVARAGFLSINAAAAWLPWILLCLTPRQEDGEDRYPPLWGLILCLGMQLLAGHAQTTWYTLILAGMWSGYWGWESAGGEAAPTGRRRAILAAWGRMALALGLAVGLAAVQLLPTAEYLLQSQRSSAVEYELAMTYSFWPWRLLTLLTPDLYGTPVRGDYWGYANYWEDAIYIGLLPFLLALAGCIRAGKYLEREAGSHPEGLKARFSRLRWFLLFVFGLALLLALGKNTPVFPWLYRHVPTFSLFQAPARYMLWAEFALAMLAALGAQAWRRPEKRALYWTRLGTAGAFAVSLGAGLAWYLMGDISPSFIRATALAGMWGIGAGVLSLVAPVAGEAAGPAVGRWSWGVALFVAADLFVAGLGLNPGVDLQAYHFSPLASDVRSLSAGQRVFIPAEDERELKYERFLRFDSFDPGEDWRNLRAVILPNLNLLDGLPSANNFDPLLPGRYATWMERLAESDEPLRQRLLSWMGVGVIQQVDAGAPYGVRFAALQGSQRARWLPCARTVAEGEQAWQALAQAEDLTTTVILEDRQAQPGEECLATPDGAASNEISIVSDEPGEVRIAARLAAPGWLALADVWYPGWTARLDGKKVPLLRANYLFRAVRVEAGEHEIVFSYRPASFWIGLSFSLATVLFLFASRRWKRIA
ncbi:MAG: YfhO family protein [Chloroflexota bacterium]